MQKIRSCTLSIAGFDPSAGAGILSDIKTFENNLVYGFGICSALTFQNDICFETVKWTSLNDIKKQIDILYQRYPIDWVKIGIIKNFPILQNLINHLLKKNKNVKIIWDPILKASAGFQFHIPIKKNELIPICKKIFLITPNYEEIKLLFPEEKEAEAAKQLSKYCAVLLKGGHRLDNKRATDVLYYQSSTYEYKGIYQSEYKKHGSGCVLSSAILANLSKGKALPAACKSAKQYIIPFLKSNSSLLGYHSHA